MAAFAYPTLKKICREGGYRGSFVYEAYKYFGLQVEISKKGARLASFTKTLYSGAQFCVAQSLLPIRIMS